MNEYEMGDVRVDPEAAVVDAGVEGARRGGDDGFVANFRRHRWTWLVALVTAIIGASVASWLSLPSRGGVLACSNAYVFYANGDPATGCIVSNGIGLAKRTDARGVFVTSETWISGHTAMVYGPFGADGTRPFLGQYVMQRLENGEWRPITLTRSSASPSAPDRDAAGGVSG
ncbi:MAG: hypothetical protein R3F34_15440 [Planctomycetota bacterium]